MTNKAKGRVFYADGVRTTYIMDFGQGELWLVSRDKDGDETKIRLDIDIAIDMSKTILENYEGVKR